MTKYTTIRIAAACTQDRSEPEAAPAASAALRQRIEAIEQDIAEAQADLDRLMAERRAVDTQAETAAALQVPAIQTPHYYTERGRQIGEWEYPIDAEWSIIGDLPTYRVEREKGEKTWKVYEVTTVDGGTAWQRNERRLIARDLTRRAAEALARERLETNYRAAAPAPVRRRQQLGEEIARINARIAALEAEVEALVPDLERAAAAEMAAERAVTMSAEAVMPQDGFSLTAPKGRPIPRSGCRCTCYEDEDDCLVAAAETVARERDLMGWDLDPRWEDDQREIILLDIPAYAVRATDDILS